MIRYDLPADKYHQHPALSSSVVKMLRQKTPAHVRAYLDSEDRKTTPAQALGTVTHSAILEPDLLEATYLVAERPDLRRKGNKEAWQEVQDQAQREGKTLCAQADFDKARAMRDAVHAHPEARLVLAKGKPEVSIFTTDEGVDLRARLDWKPEGFDVIADLKTCQDASPHGFSRQAFNLGYPISAHHYLRCWENETDTACDFMWIAVESETPHPVACYYAEPMVMEWAEKEWRAAVDTWRECLRTDKWPGYHEHSTPLPIPGWVARQIEGTL